MIKYNIDSEIYKNQRHCLSDKHDEWKKEQEMREFTNAISYDGARAVLFNIMKKYDISPQSLLKETDSFFNIYIDPKSNVCFPSIVTTKIIIKSFESEELAMKEIKDFCPIFDDKKANEILESLLKNNEYQINVFKELVK